MPSFETEFAASQGMWNARSIADMRVTLVNIERDCRELSQAIQGHGARLDKMEARLDKLIRRVRMALAFIVFATMALINLPPAVSKALINAGLQIMKAFL